MRRSFIAKCCMKIASNKIQNSSQGVLESKVLS